MTACIARLIICARHLCFMDLVPWLCDLKGAYLICQCFMSNLHPVLAWKQCANSSSMVSLFFALSQVMCPIYSRLVSRDPSHTLSVLTLATIRRQLQTLYKAWPRRVPLWAVFIWTNPSRVVSIVHLPGTRSSIQWPVTAKYASELLACHASQVRLTSPLTVGP